ncbi:MAG: aldehyde dehydrogenase family protein [Methylobacter sp.]|uniref:aldehyde dehydrogenase family protein n=1 Tax=Methylobacter sp. TaxID=2051955 RepID=UPI00273127A4|nr:aldehyde dehydrogenase family protein [Methylobacter sp.]MDP1666280.1 aldehyde dehydrogenase family protein [Methylobacter sp.]
MSDTITAISALNEQALKTYPVSSAAEINEAMACARRAGAVWSRTDVKQRVKQLAQLESVILTELDTITDVIMATTGKVKTEVILGEIYPVLALLRYYQKNAAQILAPCPVHTAPLAFPQANAEIERRAYGVAAIISPWNFPFQLTLSPMLTALFCGNACVFKMSELSLPVGELIMHLLAKLDLPLGLVQQVIGAAKTGEQLINSRPDLVFFTGSVPAGRAVMAKAAQHPIPVILELGGKDAMLVFADANLERAVKAAMYGAFSNSGQVCVSVERCYVEAACYEEFVGMLKDAATDVTVSHGAVGDLGGLTTLKQFAVIEAHYNDAIAKGAKASSPLRLEGRYLYPVVLWEVRQDMRIMREETFGPLLPVMAFDSEQHAVDLANDSDYGLNASVWSTDIAKAERVARQLQVGSWAVNDVIKNIGHAGLPFGGVKNSGFGRYHGAEGLRQFTYTVAGLTSRSRLNDEPNWFPYSHSRYLEMRGFIDLMFGSGRLYQRIARNWRALQAFRGYASLNLRQHWHNLLILIFKKSIG